MNERRVLLASLLSVIAISLYSQALPRRMTAPSKPMVQAADQTTAHEPRKQQAATIGAFVDEETVSLESPELVVAIGRSSGAVRRLTLKGFLNERKTAPLEFSGEIPLVAVVGLEGESDKQVSTQGSSATVLVGARDGSQRTIEYAVHPIKPILTVSVGEPTPIVLTWQKGDSLSHGQNRLEAFAWELIGDNKAKHRHFGGPWKTEKNVPRGTFLLALADRYFCAVAKPDNKQAQVILVPSSDETIAATIVASSLEIYAGPRDYFHLKANGYEQAFPIGMFGQLGLALLWFLGLLANLTKNYGVAIILFSIAVTILTAPFSLLGFRSMRRMQALKPQVDRIMAQHKGDQQKANREVFALYKEHKISPLGGCLPMLLQMPIFIALFQAISHYINLRGARFWRISDLSLPDSLIKLPAQMPLIGSSINVLPIIMALAMYAQSRASQVSMGSAESNPTAKMLSGPLMPVMFLVMFYQFPAGLVLYWLTNSLMSMAFYRMAK